MEREKTFVHFITITACLALFGSLLNACTTTQSLLGEDEEKAGFNLAREMRANTVYVTGTIDGKEEYGLGFIVGEKDNELFIVTANHTVRPMDPMPGQDVPDLARVELLEAQGEYREAKILPLRDPDLDIAILKLARPENFQWRKNVMGNPDLEVSDKVWTIDPDRAWTVTSEPGSVYKFDPVLITSSGLRILPGHSGAPLISRSGVIGMIYQTADNEISYAYPLEVIKSRLAEWEKPWSLTKNYSDGKGWLWALIGVVAALLASSDGDDSNGNTGTITVTSQTP